MQTLRPLQKAVKAANIITEPTRDFVPVYSAWLGKRVVMLVVIRQCHVPVHCRIVGESAANLCVLIQPGWQLTVQKELILAVEEAAISMAISMN
jgi:sulfur relay (sulfurtransferase) complex TusBCD TusD component (DsrE family)